MIRTLHIVRRLNDPVALEAVEYEKTLHPITVLLIQDGVLSTVFPTDETYMSDDDLIARGVDSDGKRVSYPEICRMITEAVRVVVW